MSDNAQLRTYSSPECVVFRKTKERYGGLSNMAGGFPLVVNGIKIWSSEALYQACRFPSRPDVQKMILAERSPMTAKMKSKRFREEFSRPDWEQIKVKVMRWCLRVKLAQNWDKFGGLLLSTGEMPIVEESGKDDFWGAKQTDVGFLAGRNVLGRLLMELRQELTTLQPERLTSVVVPDIPDFLLLGQRVCAIGTSPVGTEQSVKEPQRDIFSVPLEHAETTSALEEITLWSAGPKATHSTAFDPVEITERFFTVVKSLNEFDKAEVRGVIQTLIAPTQRDICFTGNYYRAESNVESILTLKNVRDFQAVAMLARSLFELAVDIKLINAVPDSVKKMLTFTDVEKLRLAKRIVAFKTANPSAQVGATIYDQYVASNGARIDAEREALWPGVKNTDLRHWANMNLAQRVEILKAPFEELHAVNYPQLSLYVHSGMTGIVNLQKESFRALAAVAFTVVLKSYMILLTAIIDEFKISSANEKIKDKMTLAKMLPFTNGPDEELALTRALLG
jgi:ribA/ribD-fused uncharacterized protein